MRTEEVTSSKVNSEGNGLFNMIMFRYFPYWPLFAGLVIASLIVSYIYLRYATPVYEVSATVLIKDEKKGSDDSRFMESLNIYSSKKIVENEMEVIHSYVLMDEVAEKLHLYAPVSEEGHFRSSSAYLSSPIIVQVKDPQELTEVGKVNFSYNAKNRTVVIDHKSYPMDRWISSDYGTLKFTSNKYCRQSSKRALYFSLIEPKKIVNGMLMNLDVSSSSKLSTVVDLKYLDEVPKRGEHILNALVDAYNLAAMSDKKALASNTLNFVEDRITIVEHELDSIEKKIQQFKSQKGIVDLSEQGKLFLQNVGDNDKKVSEVNMQLAVLSQVERYVVSKNNHAGIVPSTLGINDLVLSKLLEKLYDAESKYETLKRTTGENNNILISVVNDIEGLRNSILENIRNQRSSLQASRVNINSTNGAYSSLLQTIPVKERQLLEINRQQAIKSNVYNFLLQKREETALSYSSTVPDIRIVDKARSSLYPVSPKKSIICIVAFLAALTLGVVIVSVKELFNRKILFRSEIEKYTQLPIAAEIAHSEFDQPLVVNDRKNMFVAEQFRHLRAALGYYGRNVSKKKLLVTSSISGEGKSFVSSNLALSISLSGKKVVLLDIDLRNPKTTEIFKMGKSIGITEFLEGNADPYEIINSTEFPNLFVVSAGAMAVNPTDLLLNGRLNELFTYLEEIFDYIIVDTSPVDPVTDAYVLAEYCDTTLYVIRHGYTSKTFVRTIDQNNKIKALKNIAIVFNSVRSRGFVKGEYGFGYGYGYENVYKERDEASPMRVIVKPRIK